MGTGLGWENSTGVGWAWGRFILLFHSVNCGHRMPYFSARMQQIQFRLVAVWCSGNVLVLINAVALHRARLVLGWVTAFRQVNYLTT